MPCNCLCSLECQAVVTSHFPVQAPQCLLLDHFYDSDLICMLHPITLEVQMLLLAFSICYSVYIKFIWIHTAMLSKSLGKNLQNTLFLSFFEPLLKMWQLPLLRTILFSFSISKNIEMS
jgi:hypothetical protein